jgi:hypothetical protein
MIAQLGKAAGFKFGVHPHMLRHACGFKLANDRASAWRPYSTVLCEDDKVTRLRLTRLSGDGSHLRQQIAVEGARPSLGRWRTIVGKRSNHSTCGQGLKSLAGAQGPEPWTAD